MTALLKPMPPDALLRKPSPQAHREPKASLVAREEPAQPSLMKPPVFAPRSVRQPEPSLDDLLAAFIADEDDEDEGEDCVPTSQMPTPVCVPLCEEPRRRRGWLKR